MKTKIMISLLVALSLLACSKEEGPPSVNEKGLTKDITDIVPQEVLDSLVSIGITVNGGNTPPSIEGTFEFAPLVLVKSNFEDSYDAGDRFNDYQYTFLNQSKTELTINVEIGSKSSEGIGSGAYIVGEDNYFTVFIVANSKDDDGGESESLQVISGKMSENGIRYAELAYLMLDDYGDVNDDKLEVGQGRLFEDQDNLAERIEVEGKSALIKSSPNLPNIFSGKKHTDR